MSKMKSGAIILLLAIPFALYVAWQIQNATKLDLAAAEPPSEKGLPDKEQLAASKAKVEKWAGDVKKVSSLTLQYRPPGPEDAASDADCKALAKAVTGRAVNLTDLEKFLNDDAGKCAGDLKEKYAGWQKEKVNLKQAADEVEKWLKNGPTGDRPLQDLKNLEELLAAYRNTSNFADPLKVATWQLEGRLQVIQALEATAKALHEKVLDLPLPLPSAEQNPLVKQALAGPVAVRDQIRRLQEDIAKAEENGAKLPPRVTTAAAEAARRDGEWAAREQLLLLFADPELFTDPKKAPGWLKQIQEQYKHTQRLADKDMIRRKVQQFCDAYIPRAARLDSFVIVETDKVQPKKPRSDVKIVYNLAANGEKPLTDLPDKLNEFNFTKEHENFDRITWNNGNTFTGKKEALKATEKSLAANKYTEDRSKVEAWSAETVKELKMKCEGESDEVEKEKRRKLAESEKEPRRKLLDELEGVWPGSPAKRDSHKLWTRLNALAEAIDRFPALFEDKR